MNKKRKIIIFVVILFLVGMTYFNFRENDVSLTTENKNIDKTVVLLQDRLSPEAYDVMFKKGTERPYTSLLNNEHRKGVFVTADTGLPVFRSEDKFDSGTGWPSFTKPIDQNIELHNDASLFIPRTEVVSKDTGAHLGHVFDDGPAPTGKRYCINGVALRFIPDEVQ